MLSGKRQSVVQLHGPLEFRRGVEAIEDAELAVGRERDRIAAIRLRCEGIARIHIELCIGVSRRTAKREACNPYRPSPSNSTPLTTASETLRMKPMLVLLISATMFFWMAL